MTSPTTKTRDAEKIYDTEDLSNDSKLVIVPSFINEPNRITHGQLSRSAGTWLHSILSRTATKAGNGYRSPDWYVAVPQQRIGVLSVNEILLSASQSWDRPNNVILSKHALSKMELD